MSSQVFVLDQEMIAIHDQIVKLQLPYLNDIRGSYSNKHPSVKFTTDYYQCITFYLYLHQRADGDQFINLKLYSNPNQIIVERNPYQDGFTYTIHDEVMMEEFVELITPDLAEILYFNADMWYKN